MDENSKKEETMGKEEFRNLAVDMKPVIKDMEDVLKKHGIKRLVSLAISTDGYFNLNVHDSQWEFKRADSSEKCVIYRCEREEL